MNIGKTVKKLQERKEMEIENKEESKELHILLNEQSLDSESEDDEKINISDKYEKDYEEIYGEKDKKEQMFNDEEIINKMKNFNNKISTIKYPVYNDNQKELEYE